MKEILFMSAAMIALAMAGAVRGDDAAALAMLNTPPALPAGLAEF